MSKTEELDPNMAIPDAEGEWLWYAAQDVGIEGRGWVDPEHPFHRLPAKAEGVVPEPVWSLSTHSAGLHLRFVTDAPRIAARWNVTYESLAMDHMPATGVSGVDLYAKGDRGWAWLGTGRPKAFPENQCLLAQDIPPGVHELLLNLPLYNGVESLSIGIPPGCTLARAPQAPKPVCFYGTSITQGGCASRPGMAHTSILARRLGRPAINLGFSGNGRMEPELAALLTELDVAAYVLDCLPNMTNEMVAERVAPFVRTLRGTWPDTPIILVESVFRQSYLAAPENNAVILERNLILRDIYDELLAEGIGDLHYVSGEALLGTDGEGTVDGVHPTDLGFCRFAEKLEPVLRAVCPVE